MLAKTKLLVGDRVKVIAGLDKGKIGIVRSIIKTRSPAGIKIVRVIVSGCAMVKCHIKGDQSRKSSVISKERPIDISNVSYYDDKLDASTKIGYKFVSGSKKRIMRKNDSVVSS